MQIPRLAWRGVRTRARLRTDRPTHSAPNKAGCLIFTLSPVASPRSLHLGRPASEPWADPPQSHSCAPRTSAHATSLAFWHTRTGEHRPIDLPKREANTTKKTDPRSMMSCGPTWRRVSAAAPPLPNGCIHKAAASSSSAGALAAPASKGAQHNNERRLSCACTCTARATMAKTTMTTNRHLILAQHLLGPLGEASTARHRRCRAWFTVRNAAAAAALVATASHNLPAAHAAQPLPTAEPSRLTTSFVQSSMGYTGTVRHSS